MLALGHSRIDRYQLVFIRWCNEKQKREGVLDRQEPGDPPPQGVSFQDGYRTGAPPRARSCCRACPRVARGLCRVLRRVAGGLRPASLGSTRKADLAPMNFLLDTDTCIYAPRQSAGVLERLLAQKPEDIAVSVVTEAELRAGGQKQFRGEDAAPRGEFPSTANDLGIYVQRRGNPRTSTSKAGTRRHTDWPARYAHRCAGGGSKTRPGFE